MEKGYDGAKARSLKITTSQDNMLAYISIKYIDEVINNNNHCAFYTASDIRSELARAKITYGIIDIVIEEYGLSNCVNQIIARGKSCVEPIDDKITINFNIEEGSNNLVEQENGNIDFKSIGSIQAVHSGDVIALYVKGTKGEDGCDVFGHILSQREPKITKLKASRGCTVVDNKVIAITNGKLCVKNDTFYVYKLHEILGDVDIKSGNIKFIGDIVIYGSVKENMSVECGNCIKIYKDIERAVVRSQNNIEIVGNVLSSSIVAGGEDVTRECGINDLEDIKLIVLHIISEIKKIRKFNLVSKDKKDGEIIKVLIENNHRNLTRLCVKAIAFLNMEKSEDVVEEALATVFRDKLIFFGPINIMHYKELEIIINLIDKKLVALNEFALHPVEVKFSYCQDSKIESTGNIIITGKGEYVSQIISNDGVYFTSPSSVTRGGCITSKNVIKCANVGSHAFVRTILKVESGGHIYIDKAYQNTKIIIGRREYIFNMPCKNIHAYLGKDGEIIVNRLNLLEV